MLQDKNSRDIIGHRAVNHFCGYFGELMHNLMTEAFDMQEMHFGLSCTIGDKLLNEQILSYGKRIIAHFISLGEL